MAAETPDTPPKKSKRAAAPKAAPASTGLEGALRAAANGDYGARLDADALPAEQRELAGLFNALMDRVSLDHRKSRERRDEMRHLLESAQEALSALVTRGDLAMFQWTPIDDPVVDPLLDGFSKVIDTLRTFVREINEAALRLSSSANEVLAASTQHESSSTEQAAAIHETTATMEELKHASAQIAENAGAVARVAEETLNSARSGRGAIGEFIEAMQQIRADGIAVSESITKLLRRVERIGTVVEVIDEIADRSDLLALNAALEGSRAGEAGKGFSIVAAEMRRLAENVLDSTKEIKNLITEIREATAAAATAADASRSATEQGERLGSVAAGAVEGILAGVQETSDAARVINLATQQQRTATEQVVASMAEIEDVTRQTTQASKQATSAAAELTQLASRLSELIKRFKAD
jgi:methyl-accepting chemotaxis protein